MRAWTRCANSAVAARLAEAGRDDRLFRFGGYDQRHEVTDHFEVFVPDIHRKIPDVYPNSDRTVAEDPSATTSTWATSPYLHKMKQSNHV